MIRTVITVAGLALGATAMPLLKGLESQLASKFPFESPAGIRSILAGSLSAAAQAEGLDASYITCTRDFSGCPESFVDRGAGTCAPPQFYDGSCGELDFAGLTPAEKHEVAGSCGAVFPCMESCAKNYAASCPSGWSSGSGQCSAPAEYNGPCVSQTRFDHLSHSQKAHFEGVCGVEFCA